MIEKTCSHCGGCGKVALAPMYSMTLVLLRRQRKEMTGAVLSRIDGCAATAMNNRLARLEEFGLVTSRIEGREKFYRVV